MSGSYDVVLVGGMESMSQGPHALPAFRKGVKFGGSNVIDCTFVDGLQDASSQRPMGELAEQCAAKYNLTREDQDAYAAQSYARAREATEKGKFESEIIPLAARNARGKVIDNEWIRHDEEVMLRPVSKESLAALRPAFPKAGTTVTAGNASTLSDGASAILLMSREEATKRQLRPQWIVRGFGEAAQDPAWFTTSPALAIPRALARAGKTLAEMDFVEINEAFAAVALANMSILNLGKEKVNVYGGAVAMGHPLGNSGARIVVTLGNILKQEGGQWGCAAVCNGGGGASAVVIQCMPSTE